MLDERPTNNLTTLRTTDQRTEQLATVMFELYANGADVTEAALARENFSAWEIKHLVPAARVLAESRRIRVDEPATPRVRKSTDELLQLAADRCAGRLAASMTEELRAAALNGEIGERLWSKFAAKVASRIATLPLPAEKQVA